MEIPRGTLKKNKAEKWKIKSQITQIHTRKGRSH